jgi:hypothetical protein
MGILWGLSVGACIALIAQTYQISSDGRGFVLAWTLLLLPVMVATRSFIVTAGHYLGLLIWMMWTYALNEATGTQHLWAYLMVLPGLPVALHVMRANAEYRVRGTVLRWFMLAVGCVAFPFAFEMANDRNLTFNFFMNGLFYAVLAQLGFWPSDDTAWYKRPWGVVGALGSLVALSLYAFGSAAVTYKPFAVTSPFNGVLLAGMALLLVAVCAVSVRHCRKRSTGFLYPLAYGLIPLFCLGLVRIKESFVGYKSAAMFLEALLYFIAFGILALVSGISERKLARANVGVLILLAVILEKFLWSDLSLTLKAIAFIVAGVAFFGLSFYMNRRISRRAAA